MERIKVCEQCNAYEARYLRVDEKDLCTQCFMDRYVITLHNKTSTMGKTDLTYLGDGVYYEFDGYSVVLTTRNGHECTNEIYLEPNVVARLLMEMQHNNLVDIK